MTGRISAATRRLAGRAARAGAVLCIAAAGGAPAQTLTAADLAGSLETCELLHLTERGYLGRRGAGARPDIVTPRSLRHLADHASDIAPRLQARGAMEIQLGVASSVQAARTYRHLAAVMRQKGFRGGKGLRMHDVERLARAAFEMHRQDRGIHDCVTFKWANRSPDVFLQPLGKEDYWRIAALFSDTAFERQKDWPRPAGLTAREAFELRATRLALFYFELLFDILKRDRGDFAGNYLRQITRSTVCTDEATTHQAFVAQVLEGEGLLTRFSLIRPSRFAHRRPRVPIPLIGPLIDPLNNLKEMTDHFAPILVRHGDPLAVVIDSWVEDGGLPPHIAAYGPWMDKREAENLVTLADRRGHYVDLLLDRRLRRPNGAGLRVRKGRPGYDRVQAYLLDTFFGGHRPDALPDPRPHGLAYDGGHWRGYMRFGRF